MMEVVRQLIPSLRYHDSETNLFWKFLVFYERLDLFEDCLQLYVDEVKDVKIVHDDNEDITYQLWMERAGMKRRQTRGKDPVEYEFHEILSDSFSFALKSDRIGFAFFIYWEYREDVFVTPELIIDTIIETFEEHALHRSNSIPYLEEWLYIMDLIMKDITYD